MPVFWIVTFNFYSHFLGDTTFDIWKIYLTGSLEDRQKIKQLPLIKRRNQIKTVLAKRDIEPK